MKRLAAVGTATIALLVPAIASARPADFRTPNVKPAPAPVVAVAPSDDGFDWGAAGVGAGAVGGLVLVAAGGFAGSYRVRTRLAR
jgi:hypothetical protein